MLTLFYYKMVTVSIVILYKYELYVMLHNTTERTLSASVFKSSYKIFKFGLVFIGAVIVVSHKREDIVKAYVIRR